MTADQPSGQRQEQFLHRLGVQGVLTVGLDQALFQAGGDDGEPGPVDGLADHGGQGLRGDLDHGGFLRCRGGPADGALGGYDAGGADSSNRKASVSRVRASVATACRPEFPVTLTMIAGSMVSTRVRSPSTLRTTTLQGSRSPMDGSACSAA